MRRMASVQSSTAPRQSSRELPSTSAVISVGVLQGEFMSPNDGQYELGVPVAPYPAPEKPKQAPKELEKEPLGRPK